MRLPSESRFSGYSPVGISASIELDILCIRHVLDLLFLFPRLSTSFGHSFVLTVAFLINTLTTLFRSLFRAGLPIPGSSPSPSPSPTSPSRVFTSIHSLFSGSLSAVVSVAERSFKSVLVLVPAAADVVKTLGSTVTLRRRWRSISRRSWARFGV